MHPTHSQFKTIALATDLSATASAALQFAQSIARTYQSTLVLIHVIDPVGYAFPKGAPEFLSADKSASEELRRIEEDVRRQGIEVHSVIESGIVCERILQSVEDHHADLLILGTKGKTEAGRIALGTVARQLLARIRCPMMTVSADAATALPWPDRCRSILVSTDFSAASIAGVRWAQQVARRRLISLHVSNARTGHEYLNNLDRLRELAPEQDSHAASVEHVLVTGNAGQRIAEYANESGVDLVVLGSPASELSQEEFQASTVLRVISEVGCPVLCLPAGWDLLLPELVLEGTMAAG